MNAAWSDFWTALVATSPVLLAVALIFFTAWALVACNPGNLWPGQRDSRTSATQVPRIRDTHHAGCAIEFGYNACTCHLWEESL